MSSNLISPYELSRGVAKLMDNLFGAQFENPTFLQKTVLKVLSSIGKFISHTFNKEGN